MKANEFRIGNLIYKELIDADNIAVAGNKYVWPINGNDIRDAQVYGEKFNGYPIPLTSEWLEKFPTYRIKAGRHYGFQQAFYQIELAGENLGWRMILREGHYVGDYIKYVHQLQNLYFALTGTELEFKER